MAKVLFIQANPKPTEQSFSLSVADEFLKTYQQENPQDEITKIDLFQIELPEIDHDVFSGWGKLQQGVPFNELTPAEQRKVARIDELTNQFMEADKYIFVTPMWNFSFPPRMKAYLDAICIAGKTFKYTEQGPVGLLSGKKAVHIQARGGIYSGPAASVEFGDRYLKAVMAFIGVTDFESVIVEGMNQNPDQADAIKANAIVNAKEVAKQFAAV